jgi:hypothetical protein
VCETKFHTHTKQQVKSTENGELKKKQTNASPLWTDMNSNSNGNEELHAVMLLAVV